VGKNCLRARPYMGLLTITLLLSSMALEAAVASAAPALQTPFRPLSASGCNESVCIDVQGSGSTVSDWETTAWAATSLCTYADFWVNYVLDRQGGEVCVGGGTELESDWKNTSFPNGTVLCNTWPGIPGEPCETIEG
jgi:hypothetical protein